MKGGPVVTGPVATRLHEWIHTHGDGIGANPSGIRFTAGLYEIICEKIDEGRVRYND